ncbi:MAG TPA: glycosyltransferase family 4 protein [Candidatus Acidoferrales bacterium]|nr:glycosyltransferase family 4 protein [Candidatus Acidoferrales bacterium]
MKILAFTAGAARMYCGSCLRDNLLAAELKRQGHDIILMPMYTPTRTDEANVSGERVFMNGITVCLEMQSAFFRKSRWLLDRLWDARWMIRLAARTSIAVDPHVLGEMTVSVLRGEDGFQRKDIGKLTSWLAGEPKPDIVTLPNCLLSGLAKPIREAVGRPLCCTLQGEDLFLSQLPEPFRRQAWELIRANVAHVDGYAAVSEFAALYWRERLGVPAHKMHVVPLGINLEGCDPAMRVHTDRFSVGFLARVAPEKGLHLLADSYMRLRRETDFGGAALEAAGYLAPEHRGYLRNIEKQMKDAGFGGEFRYRGELDRVHKIEFLRDLDVFSVPCTYDEPKGLSVLEAMANGVPVVQPRRGAFPEMLERTGGGVLVEPDDTGSLAAAIHALWKNRERLQELGRRGALGVREHYHVSRMAAAAAEVYRNVGRLAVHA